MTTLLQLRSIRIAAMAVLLLAGCSQSTTKSAVPAEAAKPASPPQIVAAKTAFWPMYTAAHQWASDVVALRLTAKQLPGYRNEGGKAGMWEATFASPSLHQYRVYTYAIADAPPDTYKGVVAALAMPWGGITRDVMPVDLSMFNVDSDAAYSAAAGDATEWLKKNPGKDLSTFEVGANYRFQVPVWYMMWGNAKSGYAAFVDASSGKVVKHK